MTRAALLFLAMVSPAHAPPLWDGWRECDGYSDCTMRVSLACISGDKAACSVTIEWHREECADAPEHDDCAVFRDEAAH